MKTSLKIIILSVATSFPCVAFAEILGANIPAVLSVPNIATAFALLVIGLIVATDYSRPVRSLRTYVAFPATAPRRETHRLAA